MTKLMKQFKSLLYKNFVIKKQNKMGTLCEVGVILLFLAILAVIKLTSNQDTKPEIKQSQTAKYNISSPLAFPQSGVGYVIKDKNPNSILKGVIAATKTATNVTFYEFQTEENMDESYQNNAGYFSLGLVMEFANSSEFSYTIKVDKSSMVSISGDDLNDLDQGICRGNDIFNDLQCEPAKYITSHFSAIQSVVDLKFIEIATNQTRPFPIGTSLKMFPKREYTPSNDHLKNLVGIYMVIAFSPYISLLLTNIVKEKETKIKESMRIMGLNMLAYWLSWFTTYAVIIFIASVMTTVVLTLVKVFGGSHFLIIFFTFLLYGFSIITFSFMLTPLFTNAKVAGYFASLGTMILSCIGLVHNYLNTGAAAKWLTCLLSPIALSLSLQPAMDYSNPLTWDNISTKGDFPTSNGLIMLLVDTVLYLFLAIYLDLIFPGEYGKAHHPLFLCTLSFWKRFFRKENDFAVKRQKSLLRSPSRIDGEASNNEDIEVIPEHLLGGKVISIQKIRKVFKQGKKKPDVKALDGVSFDVYEGQITALLGHNGAGKSTLISILTGMLMPSNGTAEIYGFDIRNPEDLENIREIIGLCPQQNIIFEQLNPREHLMVYAGIKAIPKHTADEMVDTLLKEIDLDSQANVQAKNLSGGQKRKLCVGIALIGNPKIVFLDEPTSGMDPQSRRLIWSLLQSKRKERVIFLTTHFMDEADILADHKAIMSKGRIRCAGSSLFLKSRFGIGYHLNMIVNEDADVDKINRLVMSCVDGAELSRQHGKEIAFQLPLSQVHMFTDLFRALEQSNDSNQSFTAPQFGIVSYGVSMTTLEEVFLKLEKEEKEAQEDESVMGQFNALVENESTSNMANRSQLALNDDGKNVSMSTFDLHPEELNAKNMKRNVSTWVQLMALLEIRMKRTLRMPMKMFFNVILPPIVLIGGIVLLRNSSGKISTKIATELKISPDLYLQQGASPSGKKILWTLNPAFFSNKSLIQNGFKSAEIGARVVSELLLLKEEPHVVAYKVSNVSFFGDLTYTVYWNSTKVHSIPVGINAFTNSMFHIVKNVSSQFDSSNSLPITTYNKPFKSKIPQWEYDVSGQIAIMLIGWAFASLVGGFSVEVVDNRETGVRHQLRVSGTNRFVYWLMYLLGDVVMYIPIIFIFFIMIPAIDIKAFNSSGALGAVFMLLILYIHSNVFFSYTLSFLFKKWESAMTILANIINMMAILPYFAVTTVDMTSGSIFDKPFHATLTIVICIFDPPFIFMAGLYYILRAYRVQSILKASAEVDVPSSSYFSWSDRNNPLPAIYIITLHHVFFWTFMTYAIDCYKSGGLLVFPFSLVKRFRFGSRSKQISRLSTRSGKHENEDVKQERSDVGQCLQDERTSETTVLVEGLKKRYGDKQVVKDLTFKVERGEILGLLGPNGAGKTTSLNMITADVYPDQGHVYVAGYSTKTDLKQSFSNLGYCPQFDSVWPEMSIREHLKCYGLIKGIPSDKLPKLITHYAEALKIQQHLDKQLKALSGGTTRKLSLLMSMIGNSGVVILDEPSTGMDPGARRFLWTVISSNVNEDHGAILTTQSMEEAEALCTRVGIMVKGRLKCIGTTQELKSNYGGGYQLEIKFKMEEGDDATDKKKNIDHYVHELFVNAQEVEYFGSRATYKIPVNDVRNLSEVFSRLEAGKVDVAIEEYNFSQSSLEQVFLEFAREQDDDKTGRTDEDEEEEDSVVSPKTK